MRYKRKFFCERCVTTAHHFLTETSLFSLLYLSCYFFIVCKNRYKLTEQAVVWILWHILFLDTDTHAKFLYGHYFLFNRFMCSGGNATPRQSVLKVSLFRNAHTNCLYCGAVYVFGHTSLLAFTVHLHVTGAVFPRLLACIVPAICVSASVLQWNWCSNVLYCLTTLLFIAPVSGVEDWLATAGSFRRTLIVCACTCCLRTSFSAGRCFSCEAFYAAFCFLEHCVVCCAPRCFASVTMNLPVGGLCHLLHDLCLFFCAC